MLCLYYAKKCYLHLLYFQGKQTVNSASFILTTLLADRNPKYVFKDNASPPRVINENSVFMVDLKTFPSPLEI